MSSTAPSAVFPDGIPVVDVEITVNGQPHIVEVPQRYYDWSFIMAHFPASSRRVRDLVPVDDLEPVEIVPGLAVLTLAGFEYRHMATLQPYNEVAVMVPVRFRPKCRIPLLPLLKPDDYDVGFWVHHLPVTTQEACNAGIQIWGLPKGVADITFQDVGWSRRCELREGGQHVLTLSSATGETRAESRRFFAYSRRNGELLRSLVDTRAQYYAWNVPGRASFTLGPHPVAQEVRELDPHNLAIAGLFAFSARSRLHPGSPVVIGEPADSDVDTT
jgi:Acetoacetate decarboxylase (ADC)